MARRERRGPTPMEAKDDAWYEKAAARTNRNRLKRYVSTMPLFAPLASQVVPQITPEERRVSDEAAYRDAELMEQNRDELSLRHAARAVERRAYVAERVDAATMVHLDAYVRGRRYLDDPTYLADHWLQIQRRVDAGLLAIEAPEERLTTTRRMIALGQVSG